MTIRRTLLITSVVTVQILLSGCVLSIDPLIPASDAINNQVLVGSWAETNGSGRATISPAGSGDYTISYTSDGNTGIFNARLGTLGGRTILDVWPAPSGSDIREPYEGVLVAAHLAFEISLSANTLHLANIDPDSLRRAIDRGEVELDFTGSEGQLILHGNSNELRAALGPYLRRVDVLGERSQWVRITDDLQAAPLHTPDNLCFEAAAWPEANQLFRRDPHWIGGDGSSTVDLGDGRILWLFGDSWIDPSGQRQRTNATMISNTVAIQTGANPANAKIKFYWNDEKSEPEAMIPDVNNVRHWFGTGILLDDRLILFQERVRSTDLGIGFESVGWTAWIVDNPQSEPSEWIIHEIATPTNPLGVAPGFGASLRLDDYVYAFGSQDPVKSHPIFAARWLAAEARNGNLMNPEWWAGSETGWVPDSSSAPRWPLMENGQSGFTIHKDSVTQQFLAVHTQGFGPADIMVRTAPTLTDTWSPPRMIYRPAEYYRPNVMIYTARAHPELSGADVVLTYDTNSFVFADHQTDSTIYYPRFLRLARCN